MTGFMLAFLVYLLKSYDLLLNMKKKKSVFLSYSLSMAKGSNSSQPKFRVFPVPTGTLAAAVLTLVGFAV